ncbi:DNA-binding transcriptional LysR family regulator [Raoultella sp. BIGb0138]|uniref:LysR family transcriptional regulator n=1 Tax=Raoultella sp. BIGb0138 TaxID=2485115 RepID=UPI0010442B02|nr:LysR family transcriptional regulator [Raoultella sp. BIGb0138]TCW17577.1 DNA-binding transcriptional LysR family regulator [Raoultella sp. BIGb0138]
MKRGDLDDLAAFATVARTGSFTRAGAELGLSPSALSHAMRSLEQRLGVVLLARTTRSVAPTAAGKQLLQTLEPALTSLAEGLEGLSDFRSAPSGAIRLTTFHYAARTLLADKLPTFLLEHPDISVEVIVDDHLVDIVANGFDAGIRLGETVERDMIAVRIGPDVRALVVGTPDYFARHGKPTSPLALDEHICINYRLVSTGKLLPWAFKHEGHEVKRRTTGQLIVNDGVLAAATVRAGAGLGMLMEHEVAEELADGRLISVLDEWCPAFPGCHLYYPNRRVTSALRALIDTLRWKDAGSSR